MTLRRVTLLKGIGLALGALLLGAAPVAAQKKGPTAPPVSTRLSDAPTGEGDASRSPLGVDFTRAPEEAKPAPLAPEAAPPPEAKAAPVVMSGVICSTGDPFVDQIVRDASAVY